MTIKLMLFCRRWGICLAVAGMAVFLGAPAMAGGSCCGRTPVVDAPVTPSPAAAPEISAVPVVVTTTGAEAITRGRCPVTGNPIDKDIQIDYQARRIFFCSNNCKDVFYANPDKYMAIIDCQFGINPTTAVCRTDSDVSASGSIHGMAGCEAVHDTPGGCDIQHDCASGTVPVVTAETNAAVQSVAPAATQTRCPVMGGPIDKDVHIDYQGRRVYFCCGMCPAKFRANPARYPEISDNSLPVRGGQ